jgi:hypothetical protein
VASSSQEQPGAARSSGSVPGRWPRRRRSLAPSRRAPPGSCARVRVRVRVQVRIRGRARARLRVRVSLPINRWSSPTCVASAGRVVGSRASTILRCINRYSSRPMDARGGWLSPLPWPPCWTATSAHSLSRAAPTPGASSSRARCNPPAPAPTSPPLPLPPPLPPPSLVAAASPPLPDPAAGRRLLDGSSARRCDCSARRRESSCSEGAREREL